MSARRLIDKYGSIDSILAKEPRIAERVANLDEFRVMVSSARKVFRELPPIPNGVLLEQGVWDDAEVEKLMDEKHGVRFVAPDERSFHEDDRWAEVEEVEQWRQPG